MEKSSWEKLPAEQLNHLISRQMLNGENATVARLLLKRGAIVPRHFHVSEQFSLILEGKLRFVFDDQEIVVGAGEILFIPANVPHSAVAVEDTVDVDFFAPRREDWIRKEDAYCGKETQKRAELSFLFRRYVATGGTAKWQSFPGRG
jgi:quercetin dioxygenase-like cupin family protein